MTRRIRTLGSVRATLIAKAREAAIAAIRSYNDPSTQFKSETYIVLMVIAWTYLLHAYYRSKRIEYRYCHSAGKRRSFDRTKHGAFKHWELERCLNCDDSPIDRDTANNLRFLIGLRHEVEHQGNRGLDEYLSGRYQACALNFNTYITKLFGPRWSLERQLAFSIQFLHVAPEQLDSKPSTPSLPAGVRSFITDFDAALTHEEYNSERFSYRLLFKKKLVNRPGQADRVIEFIPAESDLAKQIDKEYWVKKEVERPKFMAKNVVAAVRAAGFMRFRVQPEHLQMWQAEDAKNVAKGFGTSVEGTWLWYQTWIDRCIALCKAAGDKYR
jgi:Protein of unknown function (DUF3644)